MRWLAMVVTTLLACSPKSDGGVTVEGASAPVSEVSGPPSPESSSSSDASTTDSTSIDPATSGVTTEVFEPDPMVEECRREGALQGGIEIDTPVGPVAANSAFWGWNWCCGPWPIVVLTDRDVLRVDQSNIVTTPRFEARIFVEGEAPWSGEYDARFYAGRDGMYAGTDVLRRAMILDELADPQPGSGGPPLAVSFAEDSPQWRVVGSVVAEYCPALETEPCPCE